MFKFLKVTKALQEVSWECGAVECITFVKGIVQMRIKNTHAVDYIFIDPCY